MLKNRKLVTKYKPPSLKFEPQIDAKVEAHTQIDSPSNSKSSTSLCALEALCARVRNPSSRKTFTEATLRILLQSRHVQRMPSRGEICGFV